MKLIFLGPPGAGKGTLAVRAKNALKIAHISTGDLFRNAIKNQTELGKRVKSILDSGELVPDELTTAMVEERLKEDDAAQGFILDGYPRTLGQAEAFSSISAVDAVINLEVKDEAIIKRLSGRRMCRGCGKSYHIQYLKPSKEGICDDCGKELYIRDDDQIEAIENRLKVYAKSTEPLIQYYTEKGNIINIDGNKDPEDVLEDVLKALK